MTYLEMSTDEGHGGGSWGFGNCVWAPTKKRNNTSWAFWMKVSKIRAGDIVVHLRGKSQRLSFVGFSTASGDGFTTDGRPPNPGGWGYAREFYRADLNGFTAFERPIALAEILQKRTTELEAYLAANQLRIRDQANVFLVKQSNSIRPLQGAYLSDLDDELLFALFGDQPDLASVGQGTASASVTTGSQLAILRTRIGQSLFASKVKTLYRNQCCFPACDVEDQRFLVASHIARWTDNETLRGELGNGLCFCLTHDRAFELGNFTLDENFAVYLNPRECEARSSIVSNLLAHLGEQIAKSAFPPLPDALLEHWIRIGVDPIVESKKSLAVSAN